MFEVLRCAPTQRAVEAAIMQWEGEALELAIREECGAIGMVRTADEWLAHPVGRRLAAKPVVEVEKIGDSDPIPLPKGRRVQIRPEKTRETASNLHLESGDVELSA